MNKRKKIQIDRSQWRTGQDGDNKTGVGETCLRNSDKFKCCLGFICEQVEPPLHLEYSAEPYQLDSYVEGLTEEFDRGRFENSKLSYDAISINDDQDTTPQEKEAKLTELFKDSAYELIFTGEYE